MATSEKYEISLWEVRLAECTEVIERGIMPDKRSAPHKSFFVGSASEITPVAEVGPYTFKPGNMSRAMMDAYSNTVRA